MDIPNVSLIDMKNILFCLICSLSLLLALVEYHNSEFLAIQIRIYYLLIFLLSRLLASNLIFTRIHSLTCILSEIRFISWFTLRWPLDWYSSNCELHHRGFFSWLKAGMDIFVLSQKSQLKPNHFLCSNPDNSAVIAYMKHLLQLYQRNNFEHKRRIFNSVRSNCKRVLKEAKSWGTL